MPNFLLFAADFEAKRGFQILSKFTPKKEKLSVIREVEICLGIKRG
jgi:hypothetical protein